jgi:hypothetical protein
MPKIITSVHTKGSGSLLHVLREGNYKYGTNIDLSMIQTNVILIEAISVRKDMEIFAESIRKYNSEPQIDKDGIIKRNKNGTPKPKKPSRQILAKDADGVYIKDENGNYVDGNMYDHVFGELLKDVVNENKQLQLPKKGGKKNEDTGEIEDEVNGRYNYMEEAIQFGDSDTCTSGTEDGDLAIEGLTYFFLGIKDPDHNIYIEPMSVRLPQFKFLAVVIHNDEFHFREVGEGESGEYVIESKTKDEELKKFTFRKTKPGEIGTHNRHRSTPHMHVCYIPWATGYPKGPDMQIGFNRALKQMNFNADEDSCDIDKNDCEAAENNQEVVEDYRKILQNYRDKERELMYEIADYVFNRKNGKGYTIKRNETKTNEEANPLNIPAYQARRELERKIRRELEAEYAAKNQQVVTVPDENEKDAIESLSNKKAHGPAILKEVDDIRTGIRILIEDTKLEYEESQFKRKSITLPLQEQQELQEEAVLLFQKAEREENDKTKVKFITEYVEIIRCLAAVENLDLLSTLVTADVSSNEIINVNEDDDDEIMIMDFSEDEAELDVQVKENEIINVNKDDDDEIMIMDFPEDVTESDVKVEESETDKITTVDEKLRESESNSKEEELSSRLTDEEHYKKRIFELRKRLEKKNESDKFYETDKEQLETFETYYLDTYGYIPQEGSPESLDDSQQSTVPTQTSASAQTSPPVSPPADDSPEEITVVASPAAVTKPVAQAKAPAPVTKPDYTAGKGHLFISPEEKRMQADNEKNARELEAYNKSMDRSIGD